MVATRQPKADGSKLPKGSPVIKTTRTILGSYSRALGFRAFGLQGTLKGFRVLGQFRALGAQGLGVLDDLSLRARVQRHRHSSLGIRA